ncbi:MAG: ribonuclease P protein component [Bacteroidetes bacterium]|nr:ribonuclease P protein component [Bacteroidota bacterium]
MEENPTEGFIDETFGKEYKLCSLIEIDQLFKSGKSVSTQMIRSKFSSFVEEHLETTNTFKVLISVPKRNVKKAHDRNRIKRIFREVIRKNKTKLSSFLIQKKINLHFALIFQQKVSPSYTQIELEFNKCVDLIIKKLQNEQKS